MFGQLFVRVSPKADRMLCVLGRGDKAMLYVRTLGERAEAFAVPAVEAMHEIHWGWTLSGLTWRPDGMQVAYLAADRDKDGRLGKPADRLRVHVFRWDLPVAQAAAISARPKGSPCCTSETFSPDGKTLWYAAGDAGRRTNGLLLARSKAHRKLNGVLYRAGGATVHHLAPSPDGRHLAWVAMPARPPRGRSPGPMVIVFDVRTLRVVHQVQLSRLIQTLRDAPGPVWANGSKVLCYGDVVRAAQIYHCEVRALDVATGKSWPVIRDAKALGAVGKWVFLNRGPRVVPMAQMISSIAPIADPRPRQDAVVTCRLDGRSEPVTLVPQAYLQQVVGRSLVYAMVSGEQVLVMKAPVEGLTGKTD
jgi:hypothetical protein